MARRCSRVADGVIRRWDAVSGQEVGQFREPQGMPPPSFLPMGKRGTRECRCHHSHLRCNQRQGVAPTQGTRQWRLQRGIFAGWQNARLPAARTAFASTMCARQRNSPDHTADCHGGKSGRRHCILERRRRRGLKRSRIFAGRTDRGGTGHDEYLPRGCQRSRQSSSAHEHVAALGCGDRQGNPPDFRAAAAGRHGHRLFARWPGGCCDVPTRRFPYGKPSGKERGLLGNRPRVRRMPLQTVG